MSVTECNETWEGRDGQEDEKGIVRSTRVWNVTTDSPYDGDATVRNYSGLPTKWSLHPGDTRLTAREMRVSHREGSRLHWRVTVIYSNEPIGVSQIDFEWETINPLDRSAKIRWRGQFYEEEILADIDGKVLQNSSGEPYVGITREVSDRIATVQRNLSSVPQWMIDYQDPVINADSFTLDGRSVEPGQAKLAEVEVSEVLRENIFTYRQVTAIIAIRKKGWDKKLRDEGFYELVDEVQPGGVGVTGSKIRRRIQIDGKDVGKPMLLDGNGHLLSPDFTSGLTVVTNSFATFRRVPFAGEIV